jgi:hypothetical protein
MFSLLSKSSELIPLVSSPGIGTWFSGLCGEQCCNLLRWRWMEVFSFCMLSLGLCVIHCKQDPWSGLTRWLLVSRVWFLLSTGKVAIGTWGNSQPVCSRWSDLVYSSGGSCVALQLQLWLVSSFPNKVRQFYLECSPQSQDTSSVIHQGPVFRGWLIAPLLLSAFVTFPAFIHWEFSSLTHLSSLGQVNCSTPPVLFLLDYNLLLIHFSFVGGVQSAQNYVLGGWVVKSLMVCVPQLLGLWVYTGSFETGCRGEMSCHFPQGRYFLGLGSLWQGVGRLFKG